MRYRKLFCSLGLSAFTILCGGLTLEPASAEETSTKPTSGQSTCDQLSKESDSFESKKFESKRIELYYYRNATQMVKILNELPIGYPGCAKSLPANALEAGTGVGRGGGNIVLLYGTKKYIDAAYRLITTKEGYWFAMI